MPNIIRFEIHATKPQLIIDFYSTLFGWKFTSVASMGYWRIDTSGSGAPGIDGGLVQRPGLAPAATETVNAFICTVQVESVEKILGDAVALGAVIALQTMTVPGMGQLAYIKDPDGNVLGLLEFDESVV